MSTKPQFFYLPELPGLVSGFYWNDPQLMIGNIGPFPTMGDTQTDWMMASLIEGCRQDLQALNLALDLPSLKAPQNNPVQITQEDIDLMIEIEKTNRAVAAL